MLASSGGRIVLLGVLVCLLGIAICGKAGMLKEGELSEEEKKKTISEFNLTKGLVVAIISGILSAFFSFGIEAVKPLADAAVDAGYDHLFANNVTFVVILWAGFLSNFVWITILSIRNKSYKDFTDKKIPINKNLVFSALAGTIWFLQFFFYGMGESKLGSGASSWILHMSTIILTANFWGIYRKEWHGVAKKTKTTITFGIVVILLSVVLVGIGNSI
jgi:L-rhamnose-H+ transport protein